MNPKEPLPMSKSDKLAEVDEELESAIDRLSKASESVEDVLASIDQAEDEDDAEEELDEASD